MSEAVLLPDVDIDRTAAAGGLARLLPLTLNGVRFSANGNDIIRGIDLEIASSGTTVVMGPNGSGKSVFMRLLHGLLMPTSGTIEWNGHAPDESVRRRQAMVFQRPVLLRRSVLANVRFALGVRGLAAGNGHALAMLRLARLEHLAGQPARVLSGGEQQRVAIARALSLNPDVLFLDEPAANLDPASLQAIEELIATARGRGVKIILVSHDIAHARRLADDVVFIHGGRVAEYSPAGRFFEEPQSEQARAYLEGRILV